MNRFYCLISNGKYRVGCTGQTVWVYDAEDTLLAKFKDLTYAYDAAFSPKGDIFVVKTTTGRLGVYGLEPPRLIKKFRFSKVDCSQDDNFCFSPDGERLYNIERQESTLHSALSVYRTDDFSLEKRYAWYDAGIELSAIEYDSATERYYILGFIRDTSGVSAKHYVARLGSDSLTDFKLIPSNLSSNYNSYMRLKAGGFTEHTVRYSIFGQHTLADILAREQCTLEEMQSRNASLAELWQRYPLAAEHELQRPEPVVLSEEETRRIAETFQQPFLHIAQEMLQKQFGALTRPASPPADGEPDKPLS